MKNTSVYVTAAYGVALLVSCGLISGCGAAANSPEGLVDIALAPASDDEGKMKQQKAALDLGTFPRDAETEPKIRQGLRKVLAQSDNPQVRTAAIQGLGQLNDWDSMPFLMKSLESSDPMERGRAYWASSRMLKIQVPFDPDNPDPETRKEAIDKLKMIYEFTNKNKKPAAGGG